MKYLIFILFPIQLSAMYLPQSQIGKLAPGAVNFVKKSDCESHYSETCYKRPKGYNYETHVLGTVSENDFSKPIFRAKYNVVACSDAEDCNTKKDEVQPCNQNEGDYFQFSENEVLPEFSAYCIGVEGYEQIQTQGIVEDEAKKVSFLAEKAQKESDEAKIKSQLKNMEFGKRVVALIGSRNSEKSLTPGQVKQLVESYSVIQSLLMSGSILTAKAEIEAITPDGVVITQADKDAILNEINTYLGGQ